MITILRQEEHVVIAHGPKYNTAKVRRTISDFIIEFVVAVLTEDEKVEMTYKLSEKSAWKRLDADALNRLDSIMEDLARELDVSTLEISVRVGRLVLVAHPFHGDKLVRRKDGSYVSRLDDRPLGDLDLKPSFQVHGFGEGKGAFRLTDDERHLVMGAYRALGRPGLVRDERHGTITFAFPHDRYGAGVGEIRIACETEEAMADSTLN